MAYNSNLMLFYPIAQAMSISSLEGFLVRSAHEIGEKSLSRHWLATILKCGRKSHL
jgi:hypothetical protein